MERCTSNKITVERNCIKFKKTEQIEHCLWSSLHNCLRWAPWNLSFVAIFSNIKVMTLTAKSLCGKLLWHHSRLQQQHFMGWGGGRGGGPKSMSISINWFPMIHYLHSYLLTFLLFMGATVLLGSATFLFCQKKKKEKKLTLNRGNCLQMKGFILKLLNSCIPVK